MKFESCECLSLRLGVRVEVKSGGYLLTSVLFSC